MSTNEMKTNTQDIREFHKHCYHVPEENWDSDMGKKPMPELFKHYQDTPSIQLPVPDKELGTPIWKTIQDRRSHRQYLNDPLTLPQLSQLLWASVGISQIRTIQKKDGTSMEYPLRVAPSGGARYSVETYLEISNVTDVEPGIYHYHVPEHKLCKLDLTINRNDLVKACLDQDWMEPTPVVFLFTSIFYKQQWKYKTRGGRYAYMEVGSISQNLYLTSTALELGTCAIGAFYDEDVHSYLNIDGDQEFVTLIHPVGKLASEDWKTTRR